MQTVYIDLIPQKIKPVVKASQFDDKRHVRFRLTENGEDYTLSGTETVTVTIRKPDRNIVVITPTVTANNYIDVYFTEQACACFGVSFGEIAIEDDNSKIGTCNFDLEVELSPAFGGIDSSSAIDNLTTQIEEITTEIIGENYYNKTEVDNLLDAKANASDVYTKSQTDTLLDAKANASDVYTKSQTDTLLDAKANASDVYTKSQTDTLLDAKANASDVYTKTQVDGIILDIMPVDTASGPIASFVTELAVPLVNVSSNVLATGGNGTPDNPNPINGYSSANITRCGVNLWDEEWKNGYYDGTGTYYYDANYVCSKNKIIVKIGTTLYIKKPDSYNLYVCLFDENDTFLQRVTFNTSSAYTIPSNVAYILFSMSGNYGGTYNNDISINYPSTDTTYHAYNGQTYAIAFGQTVYGGVLDVTRGKLHVTHGKYTLNDVSNLSRNSDHSFYFGATPTPKATGTAYFVGVMSDKFLPGETANQDVIFIHPNGIVRFNTANAYQSTSDCFTAIGEITVVYPLATPFDIDLTPVQINAIIGTNNVYSDTNGNTTVQFKDSIQHYIDTHTGG